MATPAPRRGLTKDMAWEKTGFAFPTWKKWTILSVVFAVQLSMNWNAAIFGNVEGALQEKFNISEFESKLGGALFLIFYAFGCELWAPFSEEFGRKRVLQWSLGLVNLWQVPCALARNNTTMVVFRSLGGLSSAGGSVTLGMVADMWEPEEQQFALGFVVLSSVAGSVIAPILGGLIQTSLDEKWIFWISLIFGLVVQLLHLCVPETRTSVLLDNEARRRRKSGQDENIYGPGEVEDSIWQRFRESPWDTSKHIGVLMWRPYKMLLTEKIVCLLSLLSGFSDMLVFLGLSSYTMILKERFGDSTVQAGVAFVALLVSYLFTYVVYLPVYAQQRAAMRRNPHGFRPERRLKALKWLVLLMPLGLLGFGFTSIGSKNGVPWEIPLLCLFAIGIANYAIYGATIDYMVAAYGPYAASATGGNGFARDFLAGTAMLWASPFYRFASKPGGEWQYFWPTLVLSIIALSLCIPVWWFYYCGEEIRRKSPMAREVLEEREGEQHQPLSPAIEVHDNESEQRQTKSPAPVEVEETKSEQQAESPTVAVEAKDRELQKEDSAAVVSADDAV